MGIVGSDFVLKGTTTVDVRRLLKSLSISLIWLLLFIADRSDVLPAQVSDWVNAIMPQSGIHNIVFALLLTGILYLWGRNQELSERLERSVGPRPDMDLGHAIDYVRQYKKAGIGKSERQVRQLIKGLAVQGQLVLFGIPSPSTNGPLGELAATDVPSKIPPEFFISTVDIWDPAKGYEMDIYNAVKAYPNYSLREIRYRSLQLSFQELDDSLAGRPLGKLFRRAAIRLGFVEKVAPQRPRLPEANGTAET